MSIWNQPVGKQAFDQAEKLFLERPSTQSCIGFCGEDRDHVQGIFTKGGCGGSGWRQGADGDCRRRRLGLAPAAQRKEFAQNLTVANVDVAFAAAQQLAAARVPARNRQDPERVRSQKLSAQATGQTKEMVDLSTRATQHLFERPRRRRAKSIKPLFKKGPPRSALRSLPRFQRPGQIRLRAQRPHRRRPRTNVAAMRQGRRGRC